MFSASIYRFSAVYSMVIVDFELTGFPVLPGSPGVPDGPSGPSGPWEGKG